MGAHHLWLTELFPSNQGLLCSCEGVALFSWGSPWWLWQVLTREACGPLAFEHHSSVAPSPSHSLVVLYTLHIAGTLTVFTWFLFC